MPSSTCLLKSIYLGVLIGVLGISEAQSKHKNRPSPKEHQLNHVVSRLTTELRDFAKNSTLSPFNGEIIFAIGNKIIAQQSICQVHHIQSVSRIGCMKYAIASLTKQITAVLILKAAEAGKLSLDDPLVKYLDPDDVKDLTLPRFQATIHQILSHTSGYIDSHEQLVCTPGSEFHYASWGYAALGQVLCHIYQRSFPDLANRLFQKITMHHTVAPERLRISELRHQHQDLIRGYHYKGRHDFEEANPEIGGNRGAAGGVLATTRDLILWNQALHQGDLLTPTSYRLLTSSYVQDHHDLFGDFGYGYGLQISDTKAGLEYRHLGHIPGYQSMMLYYPGADLTVVFLINSDRLGQDDVVKSMKHLHLIRQMAITVATASKDLQEKRRL